MKRRFGYWLIALGSRIARPDLCELEVRLERLERDNRMLMASVAIGGDWRRRTDDRLAEMLGKIHRIGRGS